MKKTELSLLMLMMMMTVVLSLAACGGGGDDSSLPTSGNSGSDTGGTTTGETIAVAGTWQITETLLSNSCSPGFTSSTETYPLIIVQQGSNLTANVFTGTISGNNINWSGTVSSTGSPIVTTMNLTVSADGKNLSGNSVWNWTNGSTSCQGTTSLTGVR